MKVWRKLPWLALLLMGGLVALQTPAAPEDGEGQMAFDDVTQKAGINWKHSFGDSNLSNIVEGTGAGCMFFDYDGDGYLDIYLVNGRFDEGFSDVTGRKLRGKLTNKLYRNNRDGTFSDVTDQAGVGGGNHYGTGCSAADYDNDGNLDILLLNYGLNVLYHNNGKGTFTDVSQKSGLADPQCYWSVSGVWFDYNGDGLLDVYVANYLKFDPRPIPYYAPTGYPGPLSYEGTCGGLYRNNGDGTFTNVTKEAGLYKPSGKAMSATAADFRNCGSLDLYVANDHMESYYFRNLGKGKFEEDGRGLRVDLGEGGQGVSNMGPVVGDIDRDGWLDLYIPNMGFGTLFMNFPSAKGTRLFRDRTSQMGIAEMCGQYAGWGACLCDFDHDGYLDVFLATGDAHHLYPEDPVIARYDPSRKTRGGKTGGFVDVSRRAGEFFKHKYVARGAAYGDFDNDGRLDILVMALGDAPHLLRNVTQSKNHWLTVVPKLANGKSDAIGARVTVKVGDLVQIHDLIPTTGYLSQSDPRPHFGLGQAAQADWVEIRWPDGRVTRLENVPADQFLKVVQEKRP